MRTDALSVTMSKGSVSLGIDVFSNSMFGRFTFGVEVDGLMSAVVLFLVNGDFESLLSLSLLMTWVYSVIFWSFVSLDIFNGTTLWVIVLIGTT